MRTPPCAPSKTAPTVESVRREHAARTIQRILVRERDPITLGVIKRRFVLRRHGVSRAYDADALVLYVMKSGDVRDPVAREQLSRRELLDLLDRCGLLTTMGDLDADRPDGLQRCIEWVYGCLVLLQLLQAL